MAQKLKGNYSVSLNWDNNPCKIHPKLRKIFFKCPTFRQKIFFKDYGFKQPSRGTSNLQG
jgi:hypothetical protein